MTAFDTAPQPLEPVPFNIPSPFETKLSNGLRVVVVEDRRLPLVSFRLAFFSGDAVDPNGHTGLTTAMVSLMTEGTENYSSREFAEKIERLGAGLNVSSSDDFTIVSSSALAMYSDDLLDLMSEVVFRPTFPEEELDLYRRNTLENLKFQRSQPNFLANERVARILYGKHPYSRVSPTPAEVEGVSREDLIKLHRLRLIPNNAVFVAVGDVDRQELIATLEVKFGDWSTGDVATAPVPEIPHRDARTITIVDRPGSAQSNIVLANRSSKRDTPDYFPLIVMNQVLGAGASSRVFMNLREEKGYTYGAYTRLDMKKLAGDFEATAEVRTAVTDDSLKEFFYELERIRVDLVSDEELADAKNYLTGVFPLRAETQEGLTGLIVSQQLNGLESDYLQTYRDKVNAVTAADVLRVANENIKPDTIAIVIVGDAGEVLPQVSGYATSVEVFDTDGNAKDLLDYATDESIELADISGKWDLSLDFQGQAVNIALTLNQDGESWSGNLSTMLGEGKVSDGKVSGNKFTGTAIAEMMGQALELTISGKVNGNELSGTLSAPIAPEPLAFSGKRV